MRVCATFVFFSQETAYVKSELALAEAEVKEERLRSDTTSSIKGKEALESALITDL